MDSVNNRGRNKFSPCFNPTADEDGPFSRHPPPPDVSESRLKKKTARRSLSGFMKAVFFKTPLWKKLRNKRSNPDSYRPNGSLSTKTQKPTNKKKTPSTNSPDPIEEIYSYNNSGRSSLFSPMSSMRTSSISSNPSSGSERVLKVLPDCLDLSQTSTNIRQHALKLVKISESYDCRGLMFIVLVCLVALIFCGRIFAILTCTSAWLFLAPGLAGPRGQGLRAIDVVDSKEYKKRVVMEGLLERKIRPRVVP